MHAPTNGNTPGTRNPDNSHRPHAMIPDETRRSPKTSALPKKEDKPWFSGRAWLFMASTLAIGTAAAFWLTRSPAPATATAPPPPPATPVSAAAVLEKNITEWDEFSGRIQPIDRVEIRPRVSGTIDAVHFEEGQLVNKGDPLFTIDPRPFQAELAHEIAVQAEAQARLGLAQTALDRSNRLIANHSIAQSELDQSNAELLGAEANLKGAAAAVLTAQLNLDYTTITSPISGRVSRAEITLGNLVNTGTSAPILTTVVSVSPVYVEFEIDEQTALRYSSKGAVGNSGLEKIPVAMGLANEMGYPHQGHLKSLDNQIDTTSGTMRVRAVFDNTDGTLTPGLFARVRTAGAPAELALLVDDRAIGTDQDKKYVMVVDSNNKASYRAVVVGPVVDGLRIIRSGLQKGEKIVVNGLQRIRPNAVLNPTEVPMDANQASAPKS